MSQLILGTRGSPLALWQARFVASRLETLHPGTVLRIEPIMTVADREPETPLAQLGSKDVFVKALEQALLEGKIDAAVHSMKDMSAAHRPGLTLAACLGGFDRHDACVTRDGRPFDELTAGAFVATSAPRRIRQIAMLRPDLRIVPMRGNVDTRLRKLEAGAADALILAAAGWERLYPERAKPPCFHHEQMVPAGGQGILALQTREDHPDLARFQSIGDAAARRTAGIEFAFLRSIRATCRTPVGVYAKEEGQTLSATVFYARESGPGVRLCLPRIPEDPDHAAEHLARALREKWLRETGETLAFEEVS